MVKSSSIKKNSWFLRKPLNAHYASDGESDSNHTLKRHLTGWHLIGIGIGAIIGAGIFVITGTAAANFAGPGLVLSFIIAGIICTMTALCYAELSAMIPVSGGSYAYAYAALGELPAWIVGWLLTMQYLASASTVAIGWSSYFSSFLNDFGLQLPAVLSVSPVNYTPELGLHWSGAILNVPAVVLIGLIAILVGVGTKAVMRFNNLMVGVKLSTIFIFILLGIKYIDTSNWSPLIPPNLGEFGQFGVSGVIRAAGILFFAYLGFDMVSTLSQDAIEPQKSIPKGILGSLCICTLAYIATTLVLTGVVSYRLLGVADPMSVALNAMGGFVWVKFLVKLAILAGLASVVLVTMLVQTRIFFAIGEDRLLPKSFAKIHPQTRTPIFSTAVTALIMVVIAGLFPVELLGQLVSLAALLIFVIVCLGVLILRYYEPNFKRPFKAPLVPFLPVLTILCCVGLMVTQPIAAWIPIVIWAALGKVIYFLYGIRHSKLRRVR